VVRKNKIRVYLCFRLVSATCLKKTGSETGFSVQNLDRLVDRVLTADVETGKQNRVLRRETGHETGFKAGQDSASCPVLKTTRVSVYYLENPVLLSCLK
jgi:hypothetical protein